MRRATFFDGIVCVSDEERRQDRCDEMKSRWGTMGGLTPRDGPSSAVRSIGNNGFLHASLGREALESVD